MPTASTTGWTSTGPRPLEIIHGNPTVVQRLAAKLFDKTYAQLTFPTGSLNKYTQPGLILAQNTVTNKYVPWRSDAAYGAGSDTAVGILTMQLTLTEFDRWCSPMDFGQVNESNIYTDEGLLGVVPAAVKTTLSRIAWR